MGQISINKVLAELRAGQVCTLAFIRGTGKKRGTKKTVYQAVEGWHYEAFKKKTPRDHFVARHRVELSKQKRRGVLPIIDLSNDQQLTVFISHITQYNGLQVKH